MDQLKLFTERQKEFLEFLKTRYYLYHASNVFFRDLHYGVMTFLDLHHEKHTYSESEKLTERVIASLVEQGILLKVANQAYLLNYPAFKKPPVKPAAPAKAAVPARPAAPAAPKPAVPSAKAASTNPPAPKPAPSPAQSASVNG